MSNLALYSLQASLVPFPGPWRNEGLAMRGRYPNLESIYETPKSPLHLFFLLHKSKLEDVKENQKALKVGLMLSEEWLTPLDSSAPS